ncbi:kinesin-like protein KIN-10C isoform X2 [Senna tora]|uniref:Kinesin-like protein KIN-10C isoform X2 n=1 Tax=Senna tora TaxID=362788 RepID=A0A834T2M8_9FABA|nr:kinesin-like protein KIN-10C isoform X2 [Senna tora]
MDWNHLKQSDCAKANSAGSNPLRKVRVVAKVRGCTDPVDWISVNKPCVGESSDGVAISFREQSSSSSRKESYLVDNCYGNSEENEIIYSRDVKPLISAVFEGNNSTIIAIGARGSGKTHVIQGSTETPGLSVLAITEFLSMAEQSGKNIAVSFYEVDHQEHAVDLLNQEQSTIFVFEDRGRLLFKGLSQIPVKSTAEFQKLYFTACAARKSATKKGNDRARRSHVGLIVHVLSDAESRETGYVGKMNFVDLAGYEDARKKSSDSSYLVETNKINKSIYALSNVCHALSTNESRVPYRESKLTRMLQDSLRGTSKILMVVCLATLDSTKKSENCSARQIMLTSSKSQMLKSVSSTAKKLTASRSHVEKKTADVIKSALKGRKLFHEASHSAKAEKAKLSNTSSTFKTSVEEEENSIAQDTKALVPSLQDHSFPDARFHMEPKSMEENEITVSDARFQAEPVVKKVVSEETEGHQEELTPRSDSKALSIIDSTVQEGHNMNKENDSLIANNAGSPPISAKLREISNNLKFLLSSTPLCVKKPEEESILLDLSSTDIVEPKTPITEQTLRVNDRWDVANTKSPWETYSMRSSGMKNSLVQEYLKFLNTANKEELKRLKGIGEKRATFILELREESPEPFKSLDDLKDIGLSAKQVSLFSFEYLLILQRFLIITIFHYVILKFLNLYEENGFFVVQFP